MLESTPSLELFAYAAAFIAGLIDAIVGGGGLIQLPALLVAFPTAPLVTILGTNKVGAICGTFSAFLKYRSAVSLDLSRYRLGVVCAFLGSMLGAYAAIRTPPTALRQVVFWLLIVVWIYFFARPQIGAQLGTRYDEKRTGGFRAAMLGLSVGFYDGFFGPGTGVWFIVGGVALLHLDFLRSSVLAKLLNIATNLAAIILFAYAGAVDWQKGVLLGVCNIGGAIIGARLAISKGNRFVRWIFLCIVGALIVKLGSMS